MGWLTAAMLQTLNKVQKRRFEELLPEIIKKLIIAGTNDLSGIRIPTGNDIWASGFDGIITCKIGGKYVAEGQSVWEFGTSKNYLKKINEDYEKRTKNPLGIDKSQTTFYLIVPTVWAARITISQWEAEHSDWKSIHVYDASVLCDWINSEPTVASWILGVFFENSVDFSEIDHAWDLFSRKTNPPFVPNLFVGDRENEIDQLCKILDQPTIKVKSDSFIDSIGFVLAALKQRSELLEKCIVINNMSTYKSINSLVHKKILILNYNCNHEIIPSDNSVIIGFNKEAISIKPDIQLNPYSKYHYYNSFIKMGLNQSDAYELYAFCHGNLRALIRRIPGTVIEYMPEWAKIEEKNLLRPIVYFRILNEHSDRELIERFANASFERVKSLYDGLLQREDSPVKKIEDNYQLINYEEAWSVLGESVEDSAFDQFHLNVKWFLAEVNKSGFVSNRFGQIYSLQQHVRNLLMNYVYYTFSSSDSYKIAEAVREVLSFSLGGHMSKMVIDNMRNLAEAAPNATLEFLNDDLRNEKSRLLPLFHSSDYLNEYTGVLFALDELTMYRSTAVQACKLLFFLYQKGYEYRITNSPKESLLTSLCLINLDVALSVQQKKDLIVFFYETDPKLTSNLICALLGKDSFWKSVRYGEHHYDTQNEITYKDIFEVSENIADLAFEYSQSNGDGIVLEELLKQYHHLSPEYLDSLVLRFSGAAFSDKELITIHLLLKERVYAIQKYQLNDEEPYLAGLESWIRRIVSECPEELIDGWMFLKPYECPSELLLKYKDDYTEIDVQSRILRIEKLKEVQQKYGITGILRIVRIMDDNTYWGSILFNALDTVCHITVIDALISAEKFATIGGYINAMDCDVDVQDIYLTFDKETQLKLLPHIQRKGFWKLLKTEKEKIDYWKHKTMLAFDKESYEQLLKYNPNGLLMYSYAQLRNTSLFNVEQAKTILGSIADGEANHDYINNHNDYYITELVKKIDSLAYSDEWSEVSLKLYDKGLVREMPLSIRLYFFRNPYSLLRYIQSDPSKLFAMQWRFNLPREACAETDNLVYFVDTLIKAGKNSFAASVVGTLPGEADGIRLCKAVRELLEKVGDLEFDNYLVSGIINSTGFRTITDGADQKALSLKYDRDASELEIFYPHAANVLRKLSRFYMNEGRQDYIHSEIYEY